MKNTRLCGWGVVLLLVFLIGGGVAAAAIFIIRFDPNPYRGFLESLISQKTGLKVEMGHLSLSRGVVVRIEARPVKLRKAKASEVLFTTKNMVLEVNLLSLLSGRVAFQVRMEDGTLNYVPEAKGGKEGVGFVVKGVRAEAEGALPLDSTKVRGEGRVLNESERDLEWQVEVERKGHVNFELRFQEERATTKGELYVEQKPPRFRAELKLNGLEIPEVLKALKPKKGSQVPLRGSVLGLLEIQGVGKTAPEIQKSLLGKGMFDIQNGALLDFNLANFLLRRITLLPGLGEVLSGTLPQPFQAALSNPDTAFELIEAHFKIGGNLIEFQSLLLKSSNYLVEGEGTVDFEGNVDFKARLILLEDLSSFLMGRVRELEFLANSQGRIVIPFMYRGVGPSARPRPDLGYLAEKLVGNKGSELLQKGLAVWNQFTARR